MQFLKVKDWQPGAKALGKRLEKELKAGRHVLWLIPGGSNIASVVAIMKALPEALTENLSIMLTDERFGLPDHRDSNYKQLLDSGFEHKQATVAPVLAEGLTAPEATHRYGELARQSFEHADIVIGQFGMGPDGHIAGILPHSPIVETTEMTATYEAPPYVRLSLTFPALRRIHVAYVLAYGEQKRQALHQLEAEYLPLEDQPAQILKELPEVYIYNDQVGEEI